MNQKYKSLLKRMGYFVTAHKIISTLILVAIVGGGYAIWSKVSAGSETTKYVLMTVSKGSLVSSVSGSGQVAAKNQTTIASEVSGTIQKIYVEAGDEVTEGALIAYIDAEEAQRAVDNAELSVQNAEVAYDKAKKEALDQADSSDSSDLREAYESGYNAIVAASINLPSIILGMNDIYYSSSHSPYFSDTNIATQVGVAATEYKNTAGVAFDAAKKDYEANFLRYKNISENSSAEEIVDLLEDTSNTLKKLLGALSGTYSTLDYIQNRISPLPAELLTDKTSVSSFVSKVNSDSSSITNALNEIENAKTSATTANLAMKSAELYLSQAKATLIDAKNTLSDHSIRAPFSGVIAKVMANEGDAAKVGTEIASIITKEQLVNISLNEIDAAKVSKDNKVTLTFDAIDGLSLQGHVGNVDIVGTVSQGVVTYSVEIIFDDIDERVKPGMTVSADIIASSKEDVIIVPSGAIKTLNGKSYVSVLEKKYENSEAVKGVTSSSLPRYVEVVVGEANDSHIEIVSGLSVGDQIVARTVTGSSSKVSSTPSLFSGMTGNVRSGARVVETAGPGASVIGK